MVSNKKTKKTSKTNLKTSERGKPKKSKINVRVVEEPIFEVEEKKGPDKVEVENFDFKKEPKKKEDISPKVSQIFHQSQGEKTSNKKEDGKLKKKKK